MVVGPLLPSQSVEGNESIKHLQVVQDLLHEAYRYRVNPSSVKNVRSQPRKGHRFDSEQCNASINLSDDRLKVSITPLYPSSAAAAAAAAETRQVVKQIYFPLAGNPKQQRGLGKRAMHDTTDPR